MGVYIFNRRKLEKYLREDELDRNSHNDFGKDVIPAMHRSGERMFAFTFEGYWKDVGTLESLWEANMDLLGETPVFDLDGKGGKIYLKNAAEPPHYAGADAVIENSIITEGCEIYGTVINSVLSGGVIVSPQAVIRDSVIMNGCTIGAGAKVTYTIMDSNTQVMPNATIGAERSGHPGVTLVSGAITVPEGAVIPAGAKAGAGYFD